MIRRQERPSHVVAPTVRSGVGHNIERLPVALPEIVAARSSGTDCYVGLKDTFMISRIERGATRFWTHGKVWDGGAGALVLHQPGDVHRELVRYGMVTYQILRLPPRLVETYVGAGVRSIEDELRARAVIEPGDSRGEALHRLQDAVAANANGLALEVCVVEGLASLVQMSTSRIAHSRPVRRALALIRERIADDITLDELAAHARIDKFHLCRAFREQIGMPPHAYLTQLRIMYAKELLAAGTKPKDVAPRVGLYDQSLLNRHFRRIVGMTPGEFARAMSA